MEISSYELTKHAAERMSERNIQPEWVERALSSPQRDQEHESDPELRHALVTIPENGDRVLRVIYNATCNPIRVVSVYFDRKLRGKL